MRKLLLPLAILFGLSAAANPVTLATAVPSVSAFLYSSEPTSKEIRPLKVKDIQKMIGRKLTLKEKIAFLILKKKLKKQSEEGSSTGEAAFIIGILGLVLLIAGLFVPYIILGSLVAGIIAIVMGSMAKRKDPSDTKARAALLMGWITLGLIAFLLLLAAIVVASWW